MAGVITSIAALADPLARATSLVALIGPAVASSDDVTLRAVLDAALDDPATSSTLAKSVVDAFAAAASDIPSNEALLAACGHCLTRLAPPRMQPCFERADFLVRWALFTVHVADEDYLRAATVLAGARLESENLSSEEKARGCVKAAMYFLRADDDVGADRVLRRGGDEVHRYLNGDFALSLQYKSAYAQLLDQKRRFVEAALRYSELLAAVSPTLAAPGADGPAAGAAAGGVSAPAAAVAPVGGGGGVVVPIAEQVSLLARAAVCAVLAPAGPARQRVMGALARDPRLGHAGVPPAVRALLLRMCRRQFVAPGDAAAFEAGLQAHQRATLSDGTSIVQRALQEHNVLAAAAVYRSVSLATLAARLGLGEGAEAAARAEAVAARMIAEGRVVGSIDQVDSMVDFEAAQRTGTAAAAAAVPASAASAAASMLQDDGPTGASDSAGDASATSLAEPPSVAALLAWDASIKRACLAVKGALDAVSAAHPRFTPA